MKRFIRTYWKTILFFAIIGIFGGFFIGLFLLDSYPENIKQQLIEELNAEGLGQFPADIVMGVITAIQSAVYGIAFGALGIWLGKKVGLWKDEWHISKKPLLIAIAVSIICGLVMILSDIFVFGKYSDAIINSYATKPTISYMLATVTYGAVIEEVMLRLFFTSLIVFVIHKIFRKKYDKPTTAFFVVANVITAILFAAGHLPATFILLGKSPVIILRCFLLNGGIRLLFGFLYRKYGLRYAMIAHGGCHIVSKLIWILFI